MYRLCYKKSIIPTVQVDYVPCYIPLNVDEVMKANGILLRCLKVFNRIKYVEDAYEDFITFKSTVTVPAIASDMTLERKARLQHILPKTSRLKLCGQRNIMTSTGEITMISSHFYSRHHPSCSSNDLNTF